MKNKVMKANGAPENIYLHIRPDKEIGSTWHGNKISDTYIGYTRTDAFIEKACEYLQINLWRVVNEEPDFRQRFVANFRKYMKGE